MSSPAPPGLSGLWEGRRLKDRILLGALGVVCVTVLGVTYFLVTKQNGTILATCSGAIGTIIGLVLGRKV